MSAKFAISDTDFSSNSRNEKEEFMQDVLHGFSKKHKEISSKYFYDEIGSELFNQITRHPDYYLTTSELSILEKYKNDLSDIMQGKSFNLIELGPGEGVKTQILINQFLKDRLSFSYFPIDISHRYLQILIDKFNQNIPRLETIALNLDYLNGIKWLNAHSKQRNVVLFLGSSIGNFSNNSAKKFLKLVRNFLNSGDYFLIGFDMVKPIDILLKAYNDSDGITKAFNLNLLARMNKELGANFNPNSFYHYGTYNAFSQAMESYLISNKEQLVYFNGLNKMFHFKEFEAIHVESSQKYTLSEINQFAEATHCKIVKNFVDSKQFFVNSLWKVK